MVYTKLPDIQLITVVNLILSHIISYLVDISIRIGIECIFVQFQIIGRLKLLLVWSCDIPLVDVSPYLSVVVLLITLVRRVYPKGIMGVCGI